MSYVQSLYHIVICTKHRAMTIKHANKDNLYRYIWGVVNNNKCKLITINGIENHIHLLVDLHSQVSISDLVRDIKRASSHYAKQSELFPLFDGWSAEYAAFSSSYSMKERIIKYINNQETHHGKETFESEHKRLVSLHGMEYHDLSE